MLGLEHIVFMLVSFKLIALVARRFKDASQRQISFFIKFFAVVMAMFDPIYWVWEFYHFGRLDLSTTLPLYFCSLCWMSMPFVAFTRRESLVNRVALSYICTLNVIMGTLGLVFNVYLNSYSILSFVPIRSLIYHVFMILIPAVLWSSGYYRPQKRDLRLFFIPVVILYIPAAITHIMFGWDYCYMNGGKGTTVEIFSSVMPRGLFIVTMFVFLYTISCLFFFFPYFAYEKIRKNREGLEEIYYR